MTSPMIKRKEKSTTVLSAKNTMEDAYLKIKDTYSAASPLQKEVQSMNIHQQNAVACQLKAVMLSSRESVRSWMVILTIMATEKNVNMTSVRPFLRCISLNRKQWDSCPQLTLYLETALMKRHAEDSVAITQRALKLRLAWFKAVNFVWLLLILRNWRTFLSKNIDMWTMILWITFDSSQHEQIKAALCAKNNGILTQVGEETKCYLKPASMKILATAWSPSKAAPEDL